MKRRTFLAASACATSAIFVIGPIGCRNRMPARTRPFLYLTSQRRSSTRTVDDVRAATESGHAKVLWDSILAGAEADVDAAVLMPHSTLPERSAAAIEQGNLDFVICDAAGQRIKRLALAHLLTGERAFVSSAVRQLDAILDPSRWPDWIDQAHVRFGHPAGLRTGMLSYDSGIAYDWLFEALTEDERQRLAIGIDRRGIEPFRISMKQDPWWMRDLNNWTTTIVGGVAVAAMALDNLIADGAEIVDLASSTFERYLEIYGQEGEFNESPAYANATVRPVEYFRALDDWTGSVSPRLTMHPFPSTCVWLRYMTLPPGRTAAFGDSHVDARPWTKHVAAIAAAAQDPVIQDYYLEHAGDGDAVELIWYDAKLSPAAADGSLPLGRHFPSHGGCFSVRESWSNETDQCILYGKTSREENHEHNDAGQICIDVSGERMIVDLGSPSGYPADFFEAERWNYYNASIRGHNVLQFDDQEMRVPDWKRGDGRPDGIAERTGKMLDSEFSDSWGARMLIETTDAYEGVDVVRRAVLFVRPGLIAVLDYAKPTAAADIVLRWHTADKSTPDKDGCFVVRGEKARLSCRVSAMGGVGMPRIVRREHVYESPYDRSRTGELLEARNESYVEIADRLNRVFWLSVFATLSPESDENLWIGADDGAAITRSGQTATVSFDGSVLRVFDGVEEYKQAVVDI